MAEHVMLVDAPSLVYRAFFALPVHAVRSPTGEPVNAVHGFLDYLARLLTNHKPDRLVACFDDNWRPEWRVAEYAGYKGSRNEDPPELPGQVPRIRDVLDAAGVASADALGEEADDAIGTLTARAKGPVDIVTGDRDLFQLARDPDVRVLFTRKGVSDLFVATERSVRAKYGILPSQYVEFAILRGDPSDGLPGIPGIGEKTAATLITSWGDLDGVLKAAREARLTPRLRASLLGNVEYIAAMRRIVPVNQNSEILMRTPTGDPDALEALREELGVNGPIRRLSAALGW